MQNKSCLTFGFIKDHNIIYLNTPAQPRQKGKVRATQITSLLNKPAVKFGWIRNF